MELCGARKSMSEISSTSGTDYEAKKSWRGRTGRQLGATPFENHSSSLTPCPLLGKRPETFYSTIAVPAMKCANILELASLYGRMLVPLDLVLENRAKPD